MTHSNHGIGMTSTRTRTRLIELLKKEGIKNSQVLEVLAEVPRHLFVDEAMAHRAYENVALPIGLGQTISQPYMVARMTELILEEGTPKRVLEVGTGSGYQAAVLAHLSEMVYTIERIPELSLRARALFRALKLRNIALLEGDGALGWQDYAPYDAIVVTAAAPQVPEKLLLQLKIGGCLIVPIVQGDKQVLMRVVRTDSSYEVEPILDVLFVPLISSSFDSV